MPPLPYHYHYLFGPVPSRRLGRSLGLDLVPLKTCAFDCVFCQLGGGGRATLDRGEHVPVADVLAEFDRWLGAGDRADFVTLSGSGEPTLHTRFGDVLRAVRGRGPYATALLSSGALMGDAAVRRDACEADVVKLSLSAWDEPSFQRINRPASGLRFASMYEGMRRFRDAYRGRLWIEVFVVPGANDSPEAIGRLALLVRGVAPERVHLNTAVRPPAEAGVRPATLAALAALAGAFTPCAELAMEVPVSAAGRGSDFDLGALLVRHPATAADLERITGWPPQVVAERLDVLVAAGSIRPVARGGVVHYAANQDSASGRADAAGGVPDQAGAAGARRASPPSPPTHTEQGGRHGALGTA